MLITRNTVIIPERYRADVLNELHVNHPGIVRMKGLARMHVWWPNLDTDIEITVRNCTACRTRNPPPAATANPWIWPSKPWQRLETIETITSGNKVIVHKLGPVTYQVQVGDLVWKRHIDQIREFVPQENKDIPNILENTKSDIDTELIIVPTCNSKRDTENSENNNEPERTKITKNKTVENANDTIITRRSERVRKAPERLIENI
ncbi:unnamed protein product [Mytilus coruscus]|uniref:Integrase zinc-binding domain-containing protein n=1 Tax=Mytilus coruscus TaxID=42192 RepID=A0A6J8EV74_MYTCO|nr:unnamed protein product [Mytilus coruscus]